MADFEEKKYSIDAGPGKKMDGCPYSNYEDGHDIKDYIIPPKGYVFTGFIFDPDAKNQIYDGKLYYSEKVAEGRYLRADVSPSDSSFLGWVNSSGEYCDVQAEAVFSDRAGCRPDCRCF